MQFYKFEGFTITESPAVESENLRIIREKTRKIAMKTSTFNQHQQRNAFLFVIDASTDTVSIGAIVKHSPDVRKLIDEYLSAINMPLKDTCLEEITFNSLCSLLRYASRNDYIYDDDEVLKRFDLDKLDRQFFSHIEYHEKLLGYSDKNTLYCEAECLLAENALLPELDRIYAGCKTLLHSGHPVHYMIQTDDRVTREGMCRVLLQALYANDRIHSQRCSIISFRPGEPFSKMAFDYLYKSSVGGSVIINYLEQDDPEDNYASSGRNTIEIICEIMKKYRHQVLTVLCLPRECTSSRDIFYEELGNISLIELKEDFVFGECAKNFLKMLAKGIGVRTDKKLFSQIEEETSYLTPDLRDIFDEWYNNKLKTSIFPQYKALVTAKQKVVKTKPKGSAYDELNQMIGLDEPKKVINQALNYYKAQKLFADKGMKTDRPAMHMIFTGNPGTAKTSVARLFARIMKDNNLLSKGHLIEVGRGDLVSRFVGWTAPTIQKKFKEAQGGMLFIDEAYSLVDDRDGSFGDEAINTIVQEMENHRDDVVVIFAGYPDKMEGFLQKNPGLRSRIAFHISFNDYDTESLYEIAKLIAAKKDLTFTDEAGNKLKRLFDIARNEPDFGNGRYVRNVIEKAKMAQINRLMTMDLDAICRKDIATITAEDIEMPAISVKSMPKRIGFCA